MNHLKIIIPILVIVVALYMLITPVFGQPFYTIGEGPIRDIVLDANPGNFIVVSGHAVYVIRGSDGEIIDIYQVPDIYVQDIIPSNPQANYLYCIGGCSNGAIEITIDRASHMIASVPIGPAMTLYAQLQDNDRLYAICHDQKLYEDEYSNVIRVFDKSDLSDVGTWPCEPWPEYAQYDNNSDTIIIAQSIAVPYKEGEYVPSESGVQWLSRIGRYNPSREGLLVEEYTVSGSVAGLAINNDGNLIVGLAGEKENGIPASTFAIISDPIEYLDIDNYHVVCMDYEIATDRAFCSVFNYLDETGGHILVWDYNTREYEIIEVGVDDIMMVKFLDGKLFFSDSKDNKLYVITIDE